MYIYLKDIKNIILKTKIIIYKHKTFNIKKSTHA